MVDNTKMSPVLEKKTDKNYSQYSVCKLFSTLSLQYQLLWKSNYMALVFLVKQWESKIK